MSVTWYIYSGLPLELFNISEDLSDFIWQEAVTHAIHSDPTIYFS